MSFTHHCSAVPLGVGTTLKSYYKDVQVMSDVWDCAQHAQFWNEETQTVQTFAWVKDPVVDVTEEVKEKVKAWVYKNALYKALYDAECEAKKFVLGSEVEVVSGKTAKGLKGKIAVMIDRPYSMGYRSHMEKKLAIPTSDVKVMVPGRNGRVYENYRDVVWVWARNCVLASKPAIDMQKVEEEAARLSASTLQRDFAGIL